MRLPALILSLSLASIHTLAQDDYELFQYYSGRETKQKNSRLISETGYHQDILDRWKQNHLITFNTAGLPVIILRYNEEGKITEKNVFTYTSEGYIARIETWSDGVRARASEFATDLMGRVFSCSSYGYTSGSGEKIFDSKKVIEYNPNGSLSRIIKLRADVLDTAEIERYDAYGTKISSMSRDEEHWTTWREYHWNADKSQMEELVSIGACPQWTITHTYKDGLETGRTDPTLPVTKFYWKYNNAGWVTETNAPILFVQYNTYEERGYLKTSTYRNLDPDANEKDQPNKIEYKYEYQFRN